LVVGASVVSGDMATPGSEARTPWTFDRMIIVMAFVELLIALLVTGAFSPILFLFVGPFLIPPIVLVGILLWSPRPWAHLAAGIGISYLFILFLPFVIAGLANPSNPYEYAGTVLGLLSVAWALPAGVLAFLRGRKGRPQLSPREGWHSWQGVYSVGVALLAIGAALTSAAAWSYAASHPSTGVDFEPQASVTLTTENFMFSPSALTVARQTLTEIVITNRDGTLHTFTYELGGKLYTHDLVPYTTTRVLVFFDAAGTIPFWCIPHRDSGMTGEMTVA